MITIIYYSTIILIIARLAITKSINQYRYVEQARFMPWQEWSLLKPLPEGVVQLPLLIIPIMLIMLILVILVFH